MRFRLDPFSPNGVSVEPEQVVKQSNGYIGKTKWGDVTGTLSSQTDLQSALDGKSGTAHTHLLAAGATDVTASATELNTLDGITATTAELNYTDGVTSAIQAQLDGKVAKAGDTMTGNLAFDTDKGIRLTSGTATSTATGLIQLKSDDEDSKAIIEFYDKDDNVSHWIQAHDYLTFYPTIVISSVFTGSDAVVATGNGLPTGWRVTLTTTGTLPAPLATATNYFVRAVTANNLSFYPTSADAVADTNKIDITDVGSGTHSVVPDNTYNGNRHHHLSIEASDSAGLLQTRLGVGYGDDVVDVTVNQANLKLNRNNGETNGNIEFTGGGGGGNIKHDNDLDFYPQALVNGTKALRVSLSVGSNPTLSSVGADVLSVDDKLVVTQKLTVGNSTAQSSTVHADSDGTTSAGYFNATAEGTASTGILRVVSTTTGKRAIDYRLSGDGVPRLKVDASAGSGGGTITFGNGALQDTNLYRSAADTLRTDDKFVAGAGLNVGGSSTPSSATATGTAGDLRYDANYFYVCVATDTWKRVGLSSW